LPTTTLVANTPVAKVDVASSGTLPSTGGSDSSQYSLWALGLLIGGSLLAGIRRRMSR
jgi:LPXTG-motif cell wall-anchored protein